MIILMNRNLKKLKKNIKLINVFNTSKNKNILAKLDSIHIKIKN
jgi:hypothetical protein